MIGLYCPDVPPVAGGVADHTLALARALERRSAAVTILAHRGDADRFSPLPCTTGLSLRHVPAAARAAGVSALLIQYVPFLYARRGVAPAIVWMADRLRGAGITPVPFVHEPWVPFTRLPWLVTGLAQRWQLRALVRRSPLVYTPVPRWADLLRRSARPGAVVRVAPVGATLPLSPLTRDAARAQLGLRTDEVAIGVFSPAASGFRHAWIRAAVARLADVDRVRWVLFGHGSAAARPGYPSGADTIVAGPGEPADVAAVMRALDLVAAPYVDGLTMRRSGAMFALTHGVPVVSSTGPLHDPALAAYVACEPDADAFAGRLAALAGDPVARADAAARATTAGPAASVDSLAEVLLRDLGDAGGPQA